MDTVLLDALIQAGGTILAAFVGVLTWYLASRSDRNRDREDRRRAIEAEYSARQQRVSDIVVAVHAEIMASLRGVAMQTDEGERRYFRENDNPFAVADETDFVFQSIKGDLSILPVEVLHEVVAYYKLAAQTNLMTKAIGEPAFARQSTDEKRKFIDELLALMDEQARVGRYAMTRLEDHGQTADLGLAGKRQSLERALSNSRADRSGHSRSPADNISNFAEI